MCFVLFPSLVNTFVGKPSFSASVDTEGANRSAGRWYRQIQSSSGSGDLIAVGPDGRGGMIKVLKSHEQIFVGSRFQVELVILFFRILNLSIIIRRYLIWNTTSSPKPPGRFEDAKTCCQARESV